LPSSGHGLFELPWPGQGSQTVGDEHIDVSHEQGKVCGFAKIGGPAPAIPCRFRLSRQQDDGQVSKCRLAPHAPAKFGTIHFRHIKVRHDKARKNVHELVQCLTPAFRQHGVTAVRFQDQLKGPEILGVVVDQEDC
jgi:hypothetical protein